MSAATDARSFAELTAALNALPARFHVLTDAPAGSVSLATLRDGTGAARDLIERHAAVRGFDDVAWSRANQRGQTAASLTVQGITMRLAGVALAALVLEGSLLHAAPEDVHVGVQGPMFSVTLTAASVTAAPDPAVALEQWGAHWVDGHLRSLVDAVRGAQRVGEALLWGNVASAIAATFVFFDWWDPNCDARRLAERALDLGSPILGGTSWLTDLEVEGRVGLRSERAACCLMKLVPGAHLCPTCPKTTEAERIASTAQHVHHLFAVRSGAASGPPPWAKQS